MPEEVVEDDEMFERAQNEDFGSGPFELESFNRSGESTFTRFDGYHLADENGDAYPYFDGAVMNIYPDNTTLTTNLQNNELDLLTNTLPTEVYEQVQDSPGVETAEVPGGLSFPMLMNPNVEPFDNRRVRHAIKHAVDKEGVLQVANDGLGVLAQDNFISPVHQYYADLDDPFGPGAQIEEAQALLEEAGYPDGIDIDLSLVSPNEIDVAIGDSAVAMQDMCAQAGINFEIEQVSSDFWLSNVEGQGDFYMGVYSLRAIEDNILRQVLYSEGPWNYGFENEEFDEAIDAARATTDQQERQEYYTRAQEIAQMNAGMVVPFFSSSIAAYGDYLQNYTEDPTTLKLDIHEFYFDETAP